MEKKIKVGLIGYGYWGPNLMRNLVSSPKFEAVGLVDKDEKSHEKCLALYPFLKVETELTKFLETRNPDAMVIATPPGTHAALAEICLKAGKHILVEKPLTLDSKDGERLLNLAQERNLQIMVDHTFSYNAAVCYMADLIKKGDLGDLLYFDSTRINLGGFQSTTNVLWDLAPHDLSILDLMTNGQMPHTVTAKGASHFDSKVETICYATLQYENSFIAHLHLNWAAPVKIRQIMVGGDKKMIMYDDNVPLEKIKVYNKTVDLKQSTKDLRVDYRVGDMLAPAISTMEPLATMIEEFANCITTGDPSKTSGVAGLRIVKVLEALQKSMDQQGAPVQLKFEGIKLVA